jgi:hypothetical protein
MAWPNGLSSASRGANEPVARRQVLFINPQEARAMTTYHINPTPMGWAMATEGSDEALLRTLTKEEMLAELPAYMDGKTASVKIFTRDDSLEEQREYPDYARSNPVLS